MLNIVIPMAGAGTRFSAKGYKDPKPLIPIRGVPMIQLVINNLMPAQDHRFIFVCQNTHIDSYGLREKLASWSNGGHVIGIDGVTGGAACTVLKAKGLIDSDEPLMIANSDQFIDVNINDYLSAVGTAPMDGMIMTMWADDPKWSFVSVGSEGWISRVVEKEVISNEATVGVYNFVRGRDYVAAAEEMIAGNHRVNNEFYVAPVYNALIARGGRFGIFNIGAVGAGMYGLGTPEDLEVFLLAPPPRAAQGGL